LSQPAPATAAAYTGDPRPALRELLGLRLIVLGGKGGVGRTTVAAALALALARRGRRVLLAQTNGKSRLPTMLGSAPIGDQLVRVRDRLYVVNMTPHAALHEYGLMVLKYETVYRAVFENRMARYFIRAIPGLDDYAMLGKAWYHTTEEQEAGEWRFHTVILDGPATGHVLAMLRIPGSILAAVPDGPLTRDARLAQELLTDPARCRMLLVTLAEDLPVNETLELDKAARAMGLTVGGCVVNQVWPDRFTRDGAPKRVLDALDSVELAGAAPVLAPLRTRARTLRERRLLNERYLLRLDAELPVAQVHLPYVFTTDFAAADVEMLSRLLEEDLAR
jgi:anion-transporting  ArsA/GET3 family ATPase